MQSSRSDQTPGDERMQVARGEGVRQPARAADSFITRQSHVMGQSSPTVRDRKLSGICVLSLPVQWILDDLTGPIQPPCRSSSSCRPPQQLSQQIATLSVWLPSRSRCWCSAVSELSVLSRSRCSHESCLTFPPKRTPLQIVAHNCFYLTRSLSTFQTSPAGGTRAHRGMGDTQLRRVSYLGWRSFAQGAHVHHPEACWQGSPLHDSKQACRFVWRIANVRGGPA